ncbi:MAG TPA: hypothetical protein PKY58_01165 [Syntrophales bacterium]|nr:hypothetical protein [Syntrophales bacterium]HQN76756.1 hypothetical protein [Syntrophales bacterium]HQQ26109.1 hypothetical protein [Syntrophales bacterium]
MRRNERVAGIVLTAAVFAAGSLHGKRRRRLLGGDADPPATPAGRPPLPA